MDKNVKYLIVVSQNVRPCGWNAGAARVCERARGNVRTNTIKGARLTTNISITDSEGSQQQQQQEQQRQQYELRGSSNTRRSCYRYEGTKSDRYAA